MDSWNWQNGVALTIVLIAVVYLLSRIVGVFAKRKSSGCASGCRNCPTTSEPAGSPKIEIVPLDVLARSLRRKG